MRPTEEAVSQALAALDAVLSGPLESAGLALALEDELRPVLARIVREARAEGLETAARTIPPPLDDRTRWTASALVALDEAARTLRAGAAQTRKGAEWPPR